MIKFLQCQVKCLAQSDLELNFNSLLVSERLWVVLLSFLLLLIISKQIDILKIDAFCCYNQNCFLLLLFFKRSDSCAGIADESMT